MDRSYEWCFALLGVMSNPSFKRVGGRKIPSLLSKLPFARLTKCLDTNPSRLGIRSRRIPYSNCHTLQLETMFSLPRGQVPKVLGLDVLRIRLGILATRVTTYLTHCIRCQPHGFVFSPSTAPDLPVFSSCHSELHVCSTLTDSQLLKTLGDRGGPS